MRQPGQPDCLQIVNGPEDGAEFSLVRSPAIIGQDPLCTILISLDSMAAPRQAQLSVVADGYRIRRIGRGKVYANGQEVGIFRSRIIQDGGYIQVGQTMFVLECASDGLARRSRGLVSESDIIWTVRRISRTVASFVRMTLGWIPWAIAHVLSNWWILLGIAVVLYLIWPPFNRFVYLLYFNTIRRLIDLF